MSDAPTQQDLERDLVADLELVDRAAMIIPPIAGIPSEFLRPPREVLELAGIALASLRRAIMAEDRVEWLKVALEDTPCVCVHGQQCPRCRALARLEGRDDA